MDGKGVTFYNASSIVINEEGRTCDFVACSAFFAWLIGGLGGWLLEHRCRHRVDRRQEISDQVPAIPSIPAGKELAGIGADIHPAGIFNVGTHRVPQDTQQHARPFRHSLPERLPVFPAIPVPAHRDFISIIIPAPGFFNPNYDVTGVLAYLGMRTPK